MSIDPEVLADAKKSLRIFDVYFRDEKVTVDPELTPHFWPDFDRSLFKMVTRVLHDFEVQSHDEATGESRPVRFLEIEFEGSVRCLAELPGPDKEERELLAMEVSLGLLYEVSQACSDESLEEFVRVNVPYHAVPYWREHVHGVCAKRRFRPVTVPMYNAARANEAVKVTE